MRSLLFRSLSVLGVLCEDRSLPLEQLNRVGAPLLRDDLLRHLAEASRESDEDASQPPALAVELAELRALKRDLAALVELPASSSAEALVEEVRNAGLALRAKVAELEQARRFDGVKLAELRGQLEARKSGDANFVAVQAVHGTINVILGSGDSAQLDPTQAIVLMDKLAKAVEACGKIAPRFTVQDRPFEAVPPPKKKPRVKRSPLTDEEEAAVERAGRGDGSLNGDAQVTLDEAIKAAPTKRRPPSRPTKKFPLGGKDLTERCTECGAQLGEHAGTKCPPVAPEVWSSRPNPDGSPREVKP